MRPSPLEKALLPSRLSWSDHRLGCYLGALEAACRQRNLAVCKHNIEHQRRRRSSLHEETENAALTKSSQEPEEDHGVLSESESERPHGRSWLRFLSWQRRHQQAHIELRELSDAADVSDSESSPPV
ncbi:MAG: hypothetical protein MHM6MM_001801 [Cercozoa sp. M6MM]